MLKSLCTETWGERNLPWQAFWAEKPTSLNWIAKESSAAKGTKEPNDFCTLCGMLDLGCAQDEDSSDHSLRFCGCSRLCEDLIQHRVTSEGTTERQ